MNAYELADLIGMCGDGGYNQDAATMLRQQQNEIEDLKSANRFIQNFAEEQHQRAVALESELDRAVELYTDKAIENEALEKELTDEEIVELGENTLPNEAIGFVPMWQWIEFARAILRKAQEK